MAAQPEVEFLILADRAEVHDGKVYVMGGAWDQLTVPDFTRAVAVSLALGVSVPWGAGGVEHPLSVRLETEQGFFVQPEITGTVCVQHPADPTLAGKSMRVVLAAGGLWVLPKAGTYRVVARVGDGPPRATLFRAVLPVVGAGRWQA